MSPPVTPPRGRYAPSPTGMIHVGNARTALAAWLSVRSRGGTFVWRLEDLDPPAGYTIVGQGQGGAAGFAKGRAKVDLAEVSESETDLSYTAKADFGGKLATLGSRLIQATSKKLADEFFSALVRELNGEETAAEPEKKKGRWARWLGRT